MHHSRGPVAQHGVGAALEEVGVDETSMCEVASGIVLIGIDGPEQIGTPADRRESATPGELSELGVTEALGDERPGRGDGVHVQTPPHVRLSWPTSRVDNCVTCG